AEGEDLRERPLVERKRILQQILSNLPRDDRVRLSEDFAEPGPVLLRHACQMNMEGIVSKRARAPYRSGRNGDWVKTKCSNEQECAVAGYVPSTVDSRAVGALILGYYDESRLRYAGRTGTGFSRQAARDLWKRLQPLARKTPPFDSVPAEERGRKPQWV